ncbi:MAG: dockerin type I repeat-containing protein [Ruminococcus sp.]|nr:dockerin type I repeat-containing protein [Ruminococcus sp.]
MLKKIIAAMTAALTVGCTNVLNASALSEIETAEHFGGRTITNVSAAETNFQLPDTDPTHDKKYTEYVTNLESYGYKAMPELAEPFAKCAETGHAVNVYGKESEYACYSYMVEASDERFYTTISVTERNINTADIENEIRDLINSENVTVQASTPATKTSFTINFEHLSPEESYEISLKVADMLDKDYSITDAAEYFGYHVFYDLTVCYDRFERIENTKRTAHEVTLEELSEFNKILAENDIKAHFETSQTDAKYGLVIYDEGLTHDEIRSYALKIEDLTGLSMYMAGTDLARSHYGAVVNFAAAYKIPAEIREQIAAGVTEIPVVIGYEYSSMDTIIENYVSKVNDYKKLIGGRYKYSDEERKKLIKDFKAQTWESLVYENRERAVKYTAKDLGLTPDDVNYWTEKSEFLCTVTPEQLETMADSSYARTIRLLADGEDIDRDNQAFYDSFSAVEGDANGDKNVSISDAVRILQYVSNPEKYALPPTLLINADIADNDGVTAHDAAVIQQMDAEASQ